MLTLFTPGLEKLQFMSFKKIIVWIGEIWTPPAGNTRLGQVWTNRKALLLLHLFMGFVNQQTNMQKIQPACFLEILKTFKVEPVVLLTYVNDIIKQTI